MPTRRLNRDRIYARLVFVGLLGFAVLISIAMWLYPGGNWLDSKASGHRFFANYLCDLTQPLSLSGVGNARGALCAKLAMLLFALALGGFFCLLPRHFVAGTPLSHWVLGLGQGAVLSLVLVVLTPSERFGMVHAWLALASAGLGIAAALCAVRALGWARPEARHLSALGASSLAIAAFDALFFAYHLRDSSPPPLIVPAAQKFAALLVCAWMIVVAWPARGTSFCELNHRR